ncbi:MAG: hypothetical protein HY600_06640, partial [Candidatus Omnitrophica bacterium]|nr:hypothetical protein [Candidatus Omnitrophota bacterium]
MTPRWLIALVLSLSLAFPCLGGLTPGVHQGSAPVGFALRGPQQETTAQRAGLESALVAGPPSPAAGAEEVVVKNLWTALPIETRPRGPLNEIELFNTGQLSVAVSQPGGSFDYASASREAYHLVVRGTGSFWVAPASGAISFAAGLLIRVPAGTTYVAISGAYAAWPPPVLLTLRLLSTGAPDPVSASTATVTTPVGSLWLYETSVKSGHPVAFPGSPLVVTRYALSAAAHLPQPLLVNPSAEAVLVQFDGESIIQFDGDQPRPLRAGDVLVVPPRRAVTALSGHGDLLAFTLAPPAAGMEE